MRRIAIAAVMGLAIAAGRADAQSTMARDGMSQAQVRGLEVQIEQLVERLCTLEATIERLRQQGCAVDVQPATTAEPEQATPDPWCSTITETNDH
jgi:hypothetical protein